MSYILDALNKSEQERKNRQAPGIETVHRMMMPRAPMPGVWIAGVLALLALNAGFLVYWFAIRSPAPVTMAVAPQMPPSTVTTPAASPAEPPSSRAAPIQRAGAPAGTLVTPSDALQAGNAAPVPAATETKPVRISDLPVDVQQQIPDMVFSSHIYSDDAKFRMVNINGKLLHEGDMVADGIRLVHITEEGVVLSYGSYTFEVSVLHDWSFN